MTSKNWAERLAEGVGVVSNVTKRFLGINKKEEDNDIDMEENSADPEALEGEVLIEAMTASLKSSCGEDEIVIRYVS